MTYMHSLIDKFQQINRQKMGLIPKEVNIWSNSASPDTDHDYMNICASLSS